MKAERFRRTKSVVASSAIALVVAAATFGIASVVVGSKGSPQHLGFDLVSNTCPTPPLTPPNFTVCGPAAPGPTVYPGPNASMVPLKFSNPLGAGLSVISLQVTFTNTFPSGCGVQVMGTPVSGPGTQPSVTGTQPNVTLNFASPNTLPVPGGSSSVPGTTTYDLTLALPDSGPQNACKNLGLSMTYTAMAQYTEVYGTHTAVTSSLNPSTVGQSVTYTATVTASPSSGQDPVPSSPTGKATFYDGTVIPGNIISGCSGVTVASATTTTATATCTPPVYGSPGSHPITAVYSNTDIHGNSDGNFTGSTSSPVLTQVVNPIATSLALTSTPSGSALFGQSVTLKAAITPASGPTGTVTFYLGTPTDTHTSLGTGTLSAGQATLSTAMLPPGSDSLYAVYGGATNYAASTSIPLTLNVGFSVPCINNTMNGGYTVPAGQSICITGKVNGGVTVSARASLFLNGATINGGLISTAGANALRFCGSTLNGNDNIQNSTGFVLVGDGGDVAPNGDDPLPACAGNTFNTAATLTFVNNHGGLEFGGNTVGGILNITGNTASSPQEVEANKITGTLTCGATNNPALTDDGLKNTVVGIRAGQCAGTF